MAERTPRRSSRAAERIRAERARAERDFDAYEPGEGDEELFARLRALRKRLADEQGVPPYVVFSDATLRAMVRQRPANDEEFLAVSGVGKVKLERYGAEFLEEIGA